MTKKKRPSDVEEIMEKTYFEMLDTDGPNITMRIERDADVTLRDGLERGFSREAMEFLHWQVSAWVGTRVMRAYDQTGLMAQAVTININVTLDTDHINPSEGGNGNT
jgi:hypothetical protein